MGTDHHHDRSIRARELGGGGVLGVLGVFVLVCIIAIFGNFNQHYHDNLRGGATNHRDLEQQVNRKDQYNIDLVFLPSVDPVIYQDVIHARDRLNRTIVQDLNSTFTIPANRTCSGHQDTAFANDYLVDDLLVFIQLEPSSLGAIPPARGGVCMASLENGKPMARVGMIILNREYALANAGTALLRNLIAHEFGHTLGIGTLWDTYKLVEDKTIEQQTTRKVRRKKKLRTIVSLETINVTAYIGSSGIKGYQQLKVNNNLPQVLQVEKERNHWQRYSVGGDLMAPTVSSASYLSVLSVLAMEDLGLTVDVSQAEAGGGGGGGGGGPGCGFFGCLIASMIKDDESKSVVLNEETLFATDIVFLDSNPY